MEVRSTVGRRHPFGPGRVERSFSAALETQAASHATHLAPIRRAGDSAVSAAETRTWDWIFGALFEAARAADQIGGAPHSLSNLGTMALRIPETVRT